jgi:signal transduction histidine kinase
LAIKLIPSERTYPFLNLTFIQTRISWSINLRWLAAIGYFLATLAAKYYFHLPLPYNHIWLLLCILLGFNVFYFILYKTLKEITLRFEIGFLHVHIIIDLLILWVLVHFSGGIENPIYIFFIFHVVLSSIIFPGWIPAFYATFVIVLFSLLVYLEYQHILPHYVLFDTDIYKNPVLIYLVIAVFAVTSYVTAYICATFMQIYRRIKQKIDLQNEKLIEADKQKSQFYRFTSHELKSPIIALKTSIDSVVKNFSGQMDQKAIQLLKRASLRANQMLEIIKELLILSKSKATFDEAKKETVNIHLILGDVIQQEMVQAQARSIAIETYLTGERIIINGNSEDFIKIFDNLLSNAIRYSKPGGVVNIYTSLSDDLFIFKVVDQGIGIEPEDLDRIFDEFYRSKNAKTLETFGTGLGLSLVKQIVSNYDGQIDVQSVVDKGSTFIVKLPLKRRTISD